MNRHVGSLFAAVCALLCLAPLAGAQEVQERMGGRSWTCHATVFLIGSNQQYTPATWKMETGDPHAIWGDREKSCKKYLQNEILTGSIWSHFDLSCSEQNRICQAGSGSFRIEYGFDQRPKSWTFTQSIPAPPCDCDLTCKAGYNLDTTSSPGNPRCGRILCEGAAAGIPNDHFGPHDNGIGIWDGNIYHHQPAQRGNCTFRGGSAGTWTPWLDRDDPAGTGDWETLKDFVTAGQACANPTRIECRRRGTTQLVQTGVLAGGERYTCQLPLGGLCENGKQNPGVQCGDFEVRFLCCQ